jgi:hypothetical protein
MVNKPPDTKTGRKEKRIHRRDTTSLFPARRVVLFGPARPWTLCTQWFVNPCFQDSFAPGRPQASAAIAGSAPASPQRCLPTPAGGHVLPGRWRCAATRSCVHRACTLACWLRQRAGTSMASRRQHTGGIHSHITGKNDSQPARTMRTRFLLLGAVGVDKCHRILVFFLLVGKPRCGLVVAAVGGGNAGQGRCRFRKILSGSGRCRPLLWAFQALARLWILSSACAVPAEAGGPGSASCIGEVGVARPRASNVPTSRAKNYPEGGTNGLIETSPKYGYGIT